MNIEIDTSLSHDYSRVYLEATDSNQYFIVSIGPDNVVHRKPISPELYSLILQELVV
jgi:hypothetical protein